MTDWTDHNYKAQLAVKPTAEWSDHDYKARRAGDRRATHFEPEETELVPRIINCNGELVEALVLEKVEMTDVIINGKFERVRVDNLPAECQADIILPLGRVRGDPERWRTVHRTRLMRLRL
jgi:hypothetical protein